MSKIVDVKAGVQESIYRVRAAMNKLVDRRWDDFPFGRVPHATRQEYMDLFQAAKARSYYEIDKFELESGFAIDRNWLDELALHTQVTKKKSELGYPHGRLLYSMLRKCIQREGWRWVEVVETGTARGFSALCMAKAIRDAGVDGRIITVDVLSHIKPQIWNCIDDLQGPKSRAQLLEPWADLLKMITFIQADTRYMLPRLGLGRINFAFLDAQHIESSVLDEFKAVDFRQHKGDCVVFDDVTPSVFPGVVEAVKKIESENKYEVTRLVASEQRAYALAIKK